jgi:hypothetical protein
MGMAINRSKDDRPSVSESKLKGVTLIGLCRSYALMACVKASMRQLLSKAECFDETTLQRAATATMLRTCSGFA